MMMAVVDAEHNNIDIFQNSELLSNIVHGWETEVSLGKLHFHYSSWIKIHLLNLLEDVVKVDGK